MVCSEKSPSSAPGSRRSQASRLAAALAAGAFAIGLNTVALQAAELVPLATARGGLLRLLIVWTARPVHALALWANWRWLEAAPTPAFQTSFHLAAGLLMAIVYALAIEPIVAGGVWRMGAVYGLVVWLINALVVLPLTGEGIAGGAHLRPAGIAWYAVAHFLFFLLLAWSYARLLSWPAAWSRRRRRADG